MNIEIIVAEVSACVDGVAVGCGVLRDKDDRVEVREEIKVCEDVQAESTGRVAWLV